MPAAHTCPLHTVQGTLALIRAVNSFAKLYASIDPAQGLACARAASETQACLRHLARACASIPDTLLAEKACERWVGMDEITCDLNDAYTTATAIADAGCGEEVEGA